MKTKISNETTYNLVDMCHVYMWYIQWGLVVVLAGLKGSGSGVVCVLESC